MKLLHIRMLLVLFVMAFGIQSNAQNQNARKASYKGGKPEIRTVANCDYEVLKGLAEVKEVKKVKDASESVLGYDEYSVELEFVPMEAGHQLMTSLQDGRFDFYLRSKGVKVPIGEDYIEHYHVNEGLRFAFEFLQARNPAQSGCKEKYRYSSRGMPNDLFESQETGQLNIYRKQIFEKRVFDKESEYSAKKNGQDPETFDKVKSPNKIDDPEKDPESIPEMPRADDKKEKEPEVDPVDVETPTDPEKDPENAEPEVDPDLDLDEAALREKLERELREEKGLDPKPESDADALRKQLEEEARKEFEAEQKRLEEERRKEAIKNAKKEAKEEAKRQKELERQKAEEEAKRQEQLAKKKEELKKEIEAELAAEKAAREARKEELKKQIEKEIMRETCVYQEKVSGTITIVKVSEAKSKEESLFGYKEYEVKFTFRPDNYSSIPKKDRKVWDEEYTFKLDPKGKSANPSATYIRRNEVFKNKTYKGFAQMLEEGICQALMIYSPDLPIDKDQVR